MVAGSVSAPRLDLTNEDLVRSHVHAIWLAETGQSMQSSITDLLETRERRQLPACGCYPSCGGPSPTRTCAPRAQRTAERVLADLRRTWPTAAHEPPGGTTDWVDDQVSQRRRSFDEAFDRWRELYRTALAEYHEQDRAGHRHHRVSKWDRQQAERRRADARNQLTLLRNDDGEAGATDFYSYRYLATEGFLPGYSFPRLPLAAYIPGPARRASVDGDYLQRPRFLAISEFGPGALIYHEGARYEVTRDPAAPRPGRHSGGGAITETAKRCEAAATTTRSGRHRQLRALRATRWAPPSTGCCGCRPSSPGAASGSPATRRSAAGPASSSRSPTASPTTATGPAAPRAEAIARRRPRAASSSTATPPTVRIANVGRRRRKNPTTAASGSTCARATG